MRLLLTGASGFLGQALLRRARDAGWEVTALGRTAPAGARLVPADLAAPGSLRAALDALGGARFEAILHLAVSRRHRDFPDGALDMFQVNAAAAAELLDFARRGGAARAVFGSTGTVYGAGDTREDAFHRPRSYFAASKLFADALCDLYRGLLPVAVLRFYAPYGPGLSDRLLTDLAARVREGRALTLPAEGPGLAFATTWVEDALATIEAALAGSWNETVNVAAPEVWTIESAGHLLGELLGRAPRFERGAAPAAPRLVPDLARLGALMPGRRFVGLREGLPRMLAQP
jgi:UDP-glucose 4-epimerase